MGTCHVYHVYVHVCPAHAQVTSCVDWVLAPCWRFRLLLLSLFFMPLATGGFCHCSVLFLLLPAITLSAIHTAVALLVIAKTGHVTEPPSIEEYIIKFALTNKFGTDEYSASAVIDGCHPQASTAASDLTAHNPKGDVGVEVPGKPAALLAQAGGRDVSERQQLPKAIAFRGGRTLRERRLHARGGVKEKMLAVACLLHGLAVYAAYC